MIKTLVLGLVVFALAVFVGYTNTSALAQEASPTPSPTPTPAVTNDDLPAGAPQTGYGG